MIDEILTPLLVLVLLFLVWKMFKKDPYQEYKPPPIVSRGASFSNLTSVGMKTDKKTEKNDKPSLKIMFGSQTGTSEDFAHTLCSEAKKYGFDAEDIDIEDFNFLDLSIEDFVIFVVATYGEGEPTDNAKDFYDSMMECDDFEFLKDLKFTVFGLGNKTYDHYNEVGKQFQKQLKKLGANSLYKLGDGDDDSNLEEDFGHWKKPMWRAVCKEYGLDPDSAGADKFEPRYSMVEYVAGTAPAKAKSTSRIYDMKNPYTANIVLNKELHSESSDRSCRHIEFDIGDNLSYQAGDHLGVYPQNDLTLVHKFAKRIGVKDIDSEFAFFGQNKELVVGPCSYKTALMQTFDLCSPPRKAVLRALMEFTDDEKEQQRLAALGDEDNSVEYNKWIKDDVRTILEVLQAFPGVQPPLAIMLELLPRLAPRYYSISSSPRHQKGLVSITVVHTQFTTPAKRLHNGVASTYLRNQETLGFESAPLFVRKSNFHLPRDSSSIIMVGPGTGLAPFRGFLQELEFKKKNGRDVGSAMLFFGCRNRTHDFIYEDELLEYTSESILQNLSLAFSREQAEKSYVQHKLKEEKEKLWEMLSGGAVFYVCGDAKSMAGAVDKVLHEIVEELGARSEEEAVNFVNNLVKEGKYLKDTWF